MVESETCPDCGALGVNGTCADLFAALLALDHQRVQPFGALHGLHVACYLLQHPPSPSGTGGEGRWEILQAFRTGGIGRVHVIERERVAQNRGPHPLPALPELPPRRSPATYTIDEVSVDGAFPAVGHESRVTRWVDAIVAERGGPPTGPAQ